LFLLVEVNQGLHRLHLSNQNTALPHFLQHFFYACLACFICPIFYIFNVFNEILTNLSLLYFISIVASAHSIGRQILTGFSVISYFERRLSNI